MRSVLIKSCCILVLMVDTLVVCGQEWRRVAEIDVKGVEQMTVDSQGFLYLTTQRGDIRKISGQGKEMTLFSPNKNGNIATLDIWSRFKVLAFYRNFQELVILDRFLGDPARYDLRDYFDGYAQLVAWNFQENIWVIDQTDLTLKLFNIDTGETLVDQQMYIVAGEGGTMDFSAMKEYQNRLYLLEPNTGVLILDNFGNKIDKMQTPGIEQFGFDRDEMYYLLRDSIIFINVYSLETRAIKPPQQGFDNVLKADTTFFFQRPEGLEIYNYIRKN